jgi:transposase-like protein
MSEKVKRRRHSDEFKREVVRRMRECKNILGLGRELGLDVKMMYQWKWKEEGRPRRHPPVLTTQAAKGTDLEALRRENAQLKRLLAERALELDFFKGALQQVGARRQDQSDRGETPSTGSWEKGRSQGKAD